MRIIIASFVSALHELRTRNSLKGFTLIELLIVFGVMAVLAGIGFASYSRYDQKQRHQEAAHDVLNLVQLAKSRTASQVIPGGCTNFNGWAVRFTASTYRLQYICGNPVKNNSYMNVVNYEFTLLTGISFSATNAVIVSFQPLSGTAKWSQYVGGDDTNPYSGGTSIQLRQSPTEFYTLSVNNYGTISLQ